MGAGWEKNLKNLRENALLLGTSEYIFEHNLISERLKASKKTLIKVVP